MAQWFLNRINAQGVTVYSLSAALVGHGRIVGGTYDTVEIITKGGMVGNESLLFELLFVPRIQARH